MPVLDAPLRKLKKKILKNMGKAIEDFGLIQEGDHIMVAVSGGKDSISMLYLLKELQQKAPVSFSLSAYTLDQGQPGFDASELESLYRELDVDYNIHYRDTYSVVTEKVPENKTYCSMCSRLRRGILYTEAQKISASKIALGHHADDAIETLFMNMFYAGRMAAMAPLLEADDGVNKVIRPMIYCDEADIAEFAAAHEFPIIPCNLCGSQSNLQRQRIKALLTDEEKRNPVVKQSLKRALSNVQPRHLWMVE